MTEPLSQEPPKNNSGPVDTTPDGFFARKIGPRSKRDAERASTDNIDEARKRARIVPETERAIAMYRKGKLSEEALLRNMVARQIKAETKGEQAVKEAEAGFVDSLTGLPNRNAFEIQYKKAVATAVKTGKPLHLLFLDNKGLKPINTQYGQEAGDAYLAVTGAVLRTSIGKGGKVFRYGGDEWMILGSGDETREEETWGNIQENLAEELDVVYATPSGETNSFKTKIGIRGVLASVDSGNPQNSVLKVKEPLSDAKKQQEATGENVLLKAV